MKDIKELELENAKLCGQIELLKEQNEKLTERAESAEKEVYKMLEERIERLQWQRILASKTTIPYPIPPWDIK